MKDQSLRAGFDSEHLQDWQIRRPGLPPKLVHQHGTGNVEYLPSPDLASSQIQSRLAALAWTAINTLATIGIVFTNKAIFSNPSFKFCQLSFASFHFITTWVLLFFISCPSLALFPRQRASIRAILPLAIAMCSNVVFPNLSLAHSSVTFYQLARTLLCPLVALMNFVIYGVKVPLAALVALVPTCIGIAMVSYFDSIPSSDSELITTSPLGVLFALTGVAASSLYTVWIANYHRKLQMCSMQLLFNQTPIAFSFLVILVPFFDDFPDWTSVSRYSWFLVPLSAVFASLINISHFFIVARTGPLSSTIVGHFKTCTIVALGWLTSGRAATDQTILGVLLALVGIIIYSALMLEHNINRCQQLRR